MSNKKISQLDPIGTIDVNQDSIPIVDYSENVTKRTNLANIGQRVLEASSTTNLAEGTNLYFTNTRVYTKVKATLLAGSNTSITFDDALQTITIASQGNVQSVNTKTGAVVLTTTDITEGTNEYHTSARVRAVILTGLSLVTNAVISATDSVLIAFGKLQAQITANLSTLTSHTSNTSNPHATTKAQVGLGNVADVDTTNASNITSGTLGDARLSSAVTTQGNTFNGVSQLVQLDASAKLPAVDGSNLTNLPSFSAPNGLLKIAAAISTTLQSVTDYLGNSSVLFLNSRRIGIGKDTSVTTQSVAVVEVQDANTSIVLKPNGTGAIIASVPDATATGGNARGSNAVDLQMNRGAASNVASGLNSTISGGVSNTASGTYATVVGGQSNTSSGSNSVTGGTQNTATRVGAIALGTQNASTDNYAITLGQSNTANNSYTLAAGVYSIASGFGSTCLGDSGNAYLRTMFTTGFGNFAAIGDNQSSIINARRSAALTTTATTVLSIDGTGTTNLIIPNGSNRAWNVQIDTIAVVTAITGTATGVSVGDVYSEVKNLLFKRIGGTSSIVGTVDTSFIKSNTGMSTAGITITAGGSQQMAITFTAPSFAGGGSVTCRVVSKISLAEVAY